MNSSKPGRWPSATPSDRALREAWVEFGSYLLADYPPDRRPWGFWRFDPDVPAELRAERPGLYRIEDAERVDAERNDRRSRACGWLEMTA